MSVNSFRMQKPSSPRPRGFAEWRPQKKTAELLEQIRLILTEYRDHLPLTLRQIFYRLVGAFEYPKTERAYQRLCEVMNRARRAQLIGFNAVRDDGFMQSQEIGWSGLKQLKNAIKNTCEQYSLDRQQEQPERVFLWCEAGGMAPQLERVAKGFSVAVLSSGGFDSLTVKHQMAQEFAEHQGVHVLHVGDHDPSGVHLFNSLAEDVAAFAEEEGAEVRFTRLAVIPEHIKIYGLPTAPPKTTDRRAFSGETVQVEALPPDVLAEIIREGIESSLDLEIYRQAVKTESRHRELARRWIGTLGELE